MQRTTVEPKTVVYEIVCDRCGKAVQREGGDFELMTSIGFEAGYASIFGDGNRVEIDLCEPCLRSVLGEWLRVTGSAEGEAAANVVAKLAASGPDRHGGEFPAVETQGLDDVFASVAVADAEGSVAQAPPPTQASAFDAAWVPVAELFNRLADGETLEEIEKVFPAICRDAASHALREAALRFPAHACFHTAANVWTPRYPHER